MLHLLMNDPVRGPKLAGLTVLVGILGAVTFLALLGHLASQPWDLQENGVVTRAVSSDCGPWFGDTYSIKVDGQRFDGCVEGNRKCPTRSVDILYDPDDPRRCRGKATASRPGDYEMANLFGSFGALLFGIVAVVWQANGGIYGVHNGNRAGTWFYWVGTVAGTIASSLMPYFYYRAGN